VFLIGKWVFLRDFTYKTGVFDKKMRKFNRKMCVFEKKMGVFVSKIKRLNVGKTADFDIKKVGLSNISTAFSTSKHHFWAPKTPLF
jgi:hypothetical protein